MDIITPCVGDCGGRGHLVPGQGVVEGAEVAGEAEGRAARPLGRLQHRGDRLHVHQRQQPRQHRHEHREEVVAEVGDPALEPRQVQVLLLLAPGGDSLIVARTPSLRS